MLKLAFIFLAIAIFAGILGFVVHVAAAIAKVLFFIFLIGFVITLIPSLLGKSKGKDLTTPGG